VPGTGSADGESLCEKRKMTGQELGRRAAFGSGSGGGFANGYRTSESGKITSWVQSHKKGSSGGPRRK